jgi:4-hydroxy-2-oxoheptanedioate aldolase
MPYHPPSGLRAAIRAGVPKVGLLTGSHSAQLIELAAVSRLDYVLIDGEHGDGLGIAEILALIRAADAYRLPALVRVPSNEASVIQRVLDFGAVGICVPHIRTRDDAERAVAAAKYAPEGIRAMSSLVRAHEFGSGEVWRKSWRDANDETLVLLIIEDRVGLENIDAIASVTGVDAIWIGTGDLAQDLGVAGEAQSAAKLEPAIRLGLETALSHGIVAASPLTAAVASEPSERARQVEVMLGRGYRLFFWTDATMLGAALRALHDGWQKGLEDADGRDLPAPSGEHTLYQEDRRR